MFKVNKYYPVQGNNAFQTVSMPICRAFAIDYGAMTSTTSYTRAIAQFPKGSQILSFTVRITENLETGTAGTVQFGFSGTPMRTSAAASAAAIADAIFAPMYGHDNTAISSLTAVGTYAPIVLKADDTFDIIAASTAPGATTGGAGKADVFVTYVPVPTGYISTADFLSVVVT